MKSHIFKSKLLYLLYFCALGVTNLLQAAPVYLDVNFGTNGITTTPLGEAVQANAAYLQSDGKTVVVGDAIIDGSNKFIIARYTATGSLDTSFGSGGIVTATLGDTVSATSVVVLSSGKILVGGFSDVTGTTHFFLARYSDSGVLDTSFGTSGIVNTEIGDGSALQSIKIQTDDFIVAAGVAVVSGQARFALTRYDDSGNLDTGFNGTGIVTTAIGTNSKANSLAIQADGKLVAAGFSSNHFAVARYNTNGSLDTANFGAGAGFVVTTIGSNDRINSVNIQSGDQKIVVVGFSDSSVALARYETTGALDTTFGTSGITLTNAGSQAGGQSAVIQGDGKIVVAGFADTNFLVLRYGTTGSLDANFGNGGGVVTAIGSQAQANAILLQTDGKLIAAGLSDTNIALARYRANNAFMVSITSPANGSTITTGHTAPIFGIASDSGASVAVTVNGNLFTTVTTDSNGRWNAGTSPLLNDGSNTVSVTLTVSSVQVATDSSTFTVSAAHTVTITNPAANSTINTSVVTVTGTSSKASATVEIIVDSTSLTPVTTDSSGNWNAGVTPNLVNGNHTVSATLKDGATTLATTSNNFTVAAPSKITITVPAVGSTDSSLTTPINGTSTESSLFVHVFFNGDYFKTITTNSSGNWDAGTSPLLIVGSNAVNAHLINSVGNVLASATNHVSH